MSTLFLKELAAGTLLAGLLQWIATHLAYWPARRGTSSYHWTEHARRSWSARLLVTAGPVMLLGVALTKAGNDPRGWEGTLRVILLPICVSLGAVIGGLPIAQRIVGRSVRLSDLLRSYAMMFLVLAPGITAFLVMLVLLFSQKLGPTSIGIMLGGLLIALGLNLGLSIPLVRALGLLSPPPPRLVDVVRAASERAQILPPPVYLLRWNQANAFAFPFAQALAFTEPILEILSDKELRAICLHEIAHLQESRRTKLTRLSGLLVMFPVFTIPVWVKSYGVAGAVVPLMFCFVGGQILRGFSQRKERDADAAAHANDEASCYAQALEKGYRYNAVPAVMRGTSPSHPHLYDRLAAAGMTPEYPRPQAPSIVPFFLTAFLLVFGTVVPLELLTHSGGKVKSPRHRRTPPSSAYQLAW